MSSKVILRLSQKYIDQSGYTIKNWYQIRTLLILCCQNAMIGAFFMIIPFMQQDPIFLCETPKGSGN